jgi:hypothetical protein
LALARHRRRRWVCAVAGLESRSWSTGAGRRSALGHVAGLVCPDGVRKCVRSEHRRPFPCGGRYDRVHWIVTFGTAPPGGWRSQCCGSFYDFADTLTEPPPTPTADSSVSRAPAIGLALLRPSTSSADSHVNSGSFNGGSAGRKRQPPHPAPRPTTQAAKTRRHMRLGESRRVLVCVDLETLP